MPTDSDIDPDTIPDPDSPPEMDRIVRAFYPTGANGQLVHAETPDLSAPERPPLGTQLIESRGQRVAVMPAGGSTKLPAWFTPKER